MKNAYSSIAIANYFIKLANKSGIGISPLKLQKLVYIAHGWNLALNEFPLIDERIEVWKFGPVVKSVYHEFKKFGNSNITEMGTTIDYFETFKDASIVKYFEPKIDNNETEGFLESVWDSYKNFEAINLSAATHQPGTPWDISKKNNENIINDEIIKKYYKELWDDR